MAVGLGSTVGALIVLEIATDCRSLLALVSSDADSISGGDSTSWPEASIGDCDDAAADIGVNVPKAFASVDGTGVDAGAAAVADMDSAVA